MKRLRWLGMPFALALSACALGQSGNVTRFASEPLLTGGTFSTGGGLTVASVLKQVDGKTAVCGIWSESISQTVFTKGTAKEILASGSVSLGKQRLLTGLDFFRKVPPGTEYVGLDANCRTTELEWQSRYATERHVIALPRQVVYRGRNNPGGLEVDFAQTGPGALSSSLNVVQTLFRQPVKIALGSMPALGAGQYSSGGSIRVAAELRQIGKAAYVCGVWSESRGQSARTEKQAPEVLARSALSVGGKTIMSDLRFMRRVSHKSPPARKTANCIDSGIAWSDLPDQKTLNVTLPQMIVYTAPRQTITFSPTTADG